MNRSPARKGAALATAAALLALSALPGAAGADGWLMTKDPIGLYGVAVNNAEQGKAKISLFCAPGGGNRPSMLVESDAITAYGEQRYAVVTLVGPEGSGPPGEDGAPTRDQLEIDGLVHSRGEKAFFLANSVGAGLYNAALQDWDSFELVIGRARFAFDGGERKRVTDALGGCLIWARTK